MTLRLFVGGQEAGRRHNVPDDRDFWEVAQNRPIEPYRMGEGTVYQTVTYVRIPFAVSNRRYDVFVPRGLSADDAMRMLQEGYRK